MLQEIFSFSWLNRGVRELLKLIGVEVGGSAGGSLHFFIYDVIKILILLSTMAFMMATTALSLPEMILLRKVIKPRLIGAFTGITGVGIIVVGYIFNMII